jgi:hypothetical protein
MQSLFPKILANQALNLSARSLAIRNSYHLHFRARLAVKAA